MRIISQDGTVDVQYEHVSIEVNDYDETTIMAICLNDYIEAPMLGKYKTKEHALEVMEEIRDNYNNVKKAEFLGVKGSYYTPNYCYKMPKE